MTIEAAFILIGGLATCAMFLWNIQDRAKKHGHSEATMAALVLQVKEMRIELTMAMTSISLLKQRVEIQDEELRGIRSDLREVG